MGIKGTVNANATLINITTTSVSITRETILTNALVPVRFINTLGIVTTLCFATMTLIMIAYSNTTRALHDKSIVTLTAKVDTFVNAF